MGKKPVCVAVVAAWITQISLAPLADAKLQETAIFQETTTIQPIAAAPRSRSENEELRGTDPASEKKKITSARPPKASAIGWFEDVLLVNEKIVLKSVMHTGVIISALNVPAFESFTRKGSIWVRFSVQNAEGNALTLERPVVNFYRLRRKGRPDKRTPIVQLKICVAGKEAVADFILFDRASKGNSIIFGRSFLASRFVVDPSQKFVGRGLCKERR